MSFYNNQYMFNSMENVCSSTTVNGASFSDNLSPEWCYGSPSSKLSLREDGLSVSSSVSNTPEVEEKQIFYNADMLNTSSPLLDPIILNTSSLGSAVRQDAFEESMVIPLLEQSFLTDQKLFSNSHPSIDYFPVSYNLLSATSPIPSGNYMIPTLPKNYYHTPYTSYANPTYSINSNMVPVDQYQQSQHASQNTHMPPSYSSSNFVKYPQDNMQTDMAGTDIMKLSKPTIFKQSFNTSQNSFVCSVPTCNKSFSRPYNLKSHMRTHTHERPFECKYTPCGWKFARPHDLKRHELQHTGQKPHSCRFCQKKFARSDALKRHWKVDVNCAEALQEETRLNGGNEVKYPRRKRSKKSN